MEKNGIGNMVSNLEYINDFGEETIMVSDTDLSPAYNICVRVVGILIYSIFLFWVIFNIFNFVIGK